MGWVHEEPTNAFNISNLWKRITGVLTIVPASRNQLGASVAVRAIVIATIPTDIQAERVRASFRLLFLKLQRRTVGRERHAVQSK